MNNSYRAALLAPVLAVLLSGCGGGGSSSSGSSSGTSTATTTTGSTSTPTSSTPDATISAVSAFSSLVDFRFYANGYSIASADYFERPSDRQGHYPASGPSIPSIFSGAQFANYASADKIAYGIDSAGPFSLSLRAPAASRIISPLTSLLLTTNTQARLKVQLGMDSGIFSLQSDRDLLTFDPVQNLSSSDANAAADGERLLAHHLRVLALVSAAAVVSDSAPTNYNFALYDFGNVNAYLAAAPATFVFRNDHMTDLLAYVLSQRTVFPSMVTYRDDVVQAAAHLIDAYVAATPVRVPDRATAARFRIGIAGYLIPTMTKLLRANSAAAASAISALTTTNILDATQRYAEQLPFDSNDNFFPVPDFFEMSQGSSILAPSQVSGASYLALNANDLHASASDTGANFLPGISTVTSVGVPSANQGQIRAVLGSDGAVTITALGNYVGVTYFDYVVQHQRGDVKKGRVYVNIG